eukprot:CAMPEP_0115002942 /NCGR_PEP_ID=MMETSP0216-20121206/18302_1 /TAXON_ID=223996 /ORGANISM="Protocruzia adherens, Strain Boccale" /LENGTH=580 /DNA_ID=CAMNT_0002368625 /DNA_START=35 /DNA_END=1777 /DNA_ORIENTATION=+
MTKSNRDNPEEMYKDANEDNSRWQPLYKVWRTDSRVFCRGRWITGPDFKSGIITFVLINIASLLYLIFTFPYFAEKTSAALWFIPAVLLVVVNASLFATATSDPGIVPKQDSAKCKYSDNYFGHQVFVAKPARLSVNGHLVKLKYCTTCNIYRPPRCSHCSVCDNCVQEFDHHCPWVGNCIGKRNYKYFYTFVVSLAMCCILYLTTTIIHIVDLSNEALDDDEDLSGFEGFIEAIEQAPISLILALFVFFWMFFVLGLCGFHAYLITTNQTTHEQLKGSWAKAPSGNPFSKPCKTSCMQKLCTKIPHALFNPRELVELEEDDYEAITGGPGDGRAQNGVQPFNSTSFEEYQKALKKRANEEQEARLVHNQGIILNEARDNNLESDDESETAMNNNGIEERRLEIDYRHMKNQGEMFGDSDESDLSNLGDHDEIELVNKNDSDTETLKNGSRGNAPQLNLGKLKAQSGSYVDKSNDDIEGGEDGQSQIPTRRIAFLETSIVTPSEIKASERFFSNGNLDDQSQLAEKNGFNHSNDSNLEVLKSVESDMSESTHINQKRTISKGAGFKKRELKSEYIDYDQS